MLDESAQTELLATFQVELAEHSLALTRAFLALEKEPEPAERGIDGGNIAAGGHIPVARRYKALSGRHPFFRVVPRQPPSSQAVCVY